MAGRTSQRAMLSTIAILLLLFGKGLCSDSRAAIPCITNWSWNISLEEAVHVSDVVHLQGIQIGDATQGDFGTYSIYVSYGTRALKQDNMVDRSGALGTLKITNFHSRPDRIPDKNVVFLGRQRTGELGIFCATTLVDLLKVYPEFSTHENLVEELQKISKRDMEENRNKLPLYPDPCEATDENSCASKGSECSVINTLSNHAKRCTCITGFSGDGQVCEALNEEASNAYCSECGFNARCGTGTKTCTCDHFNCLKSPPPSAKVCGSNNQTYLSLCHLWRHSCELQEPLYKHHMGKCQNNALQLCGDQDNPLHTSVALVRCNKSLSCPQAHFCDSISPFGVCCPVRTSGSGSGMGDGSFGDQEGSASGNIGSGSDIDSNYYVDQEGSASGDSEWDFNDMVIS